MSVTAAASEGSHAVDQVAAALHATALDGPAPVQVRPAAPGVYRPLSLGVVNADEAFWTLFAPDRMSLHAHAGRRFALAVRDAEAGAVTLALASVDDEGWAATVLGAWRVGEIRGRPQPGDALTALLRRCGTTLTVADRPVALCVAGRVRVGRVAGSESFPALLRRASGAVLPGPAGDSALVAGAVDEPRPDGTVRLLWGFALRRAAYRRQAYGRDAVRG
ncbi:MAG TPA: hypothetical protein VK279_05290 [Solirubrobacteraceae bacterium]|nr:hypothetical protein [Solirubrobacteraceae bacterium]